MKKTKLMTIMMISFLLPLASCSKDDTSSTTNPNSSASTSNSSHTSQDTDHELHQDPALEVKMYGDLYKDQIRTIYAIRYGVTGDIEWSSSNPDIVDIGSNPINGSMPEVNLIANGLGKAIIKASLRDDPSVYTEYLVNVSSDYLEMSEDLYSTISGGLKLNAKEEYLTYDETYQETISSTEDILTIYEENADQSDPSLDLDNLTDAFQCTYKDSKGQERNIQYVRDGRYVAKEYLDFQNNVRKQIQYDGDDPMYWQGTYCYNYFGKSSDVNASSFVSYDDGHTYHFIGGYTIAENIALNFFLQSFTPDDIYFTVEDNEVKTITFLVDPTRNSDEDNTEDILEKGGLRITGTFSDLKTATIDHLKPYAHESYHDPITNAIQNMAGSKNYTAVATRKSKGQATETYTYTYVEDSIDIVYSIGNEVQSHTGVHKKEDGSYYEYSYDETTNDLLISKDHTTPYEGKDSSGKTISRYPTYQFAAEIFNQTKENNTFETKGNDGQFITYITYLPQTWTLLNYFQDKGTLTIDTNNHITNAKTKVIDNNDVEYEINIDLKEFSTSKVTLDFSKAHAPSVPTSFEQESESLAKEMKAWNIYDALPYLYSEFGFSTSVEKGRNDTDGLWAGIRTKMGEDSDMDKVTKYIEDYKKLLVANGYTKLDSKDSYGYDFYQKGDFKVTVGYELNWNKQIRPATYIRVYSSQLVEQFAAD